MQLTMPSHLVKKPMNSVAHQSQSGEQEDSQPG